MVPADIGVIFDLDGTLVASESLYFGATERILAEAGHSLDELTPLEKSRIPGRNGLVNMQFYRDRFGLGATAEELAATRMERILAALEAGGVPLVPGAAGFVGRLRDAGFRLALASSSPRRYVTRVLHHTGLGPAFPVVMTGDDCRQYKPEPEIFLKAAEGLGLPARRCLVVEDAHAGILAARAAGMPVLAVVSDYTLPEQAALADRVVADFHAVGPADVLGLLGGDA